MPTDLPNSNRLLFIALLAVAIGCPFAIPVPWVTLNQWLSGGTAADNPGFLPGPVDNQAWFVIFGAITVASATIVFSRSSAIERISRNPVAVVALLWFFLTLIRGMLGQSFASAYAELLLQSAFVFLFATAVSLSPSLRQLRLFQVILCTAALPLAGIALLQNVGLDPLPYSAIVPGTTEQVAGKHLISSTFGHPNYMGSYLAPVIVIAVGLAFATIPPALRVLGAAAAVISILALLVGGTRGPLLAVAGGLAVFFLLNKIGRRRQAAGLIVFLLAIPAILALASGLLAPTFEIYDRLFAGKEIASRAFYWVVGLEMFRGAPIFGIGAGQFDLHFWQTVAQMPSAEPGGPWFFVLDSIIRGVRPGQMHNDHLQVLVESGLVGALAWASLWITTAYRAILVRQTSQIADTGVHNMNAAFAGAFAAVAVDAVFGFPFHLPCSGALFWVALGLWSGWNLQFSSCKSGSLAADTT